MLENDIFKLIKEFNSSTDRKVVKHSLKDLEDTGFLKSHTILLSDWFISANDIRILYQRDCSDFENRLSLLKRKTFLDICRKGIPYSVTNIEDDKDRFWKRCKKLDSFIELITSPNHYHYRRKVSSAIALHLYLLQNMKATTLNLHFSLVDVLAPMTLRSLVKIFNFPAMDCKGDDDLYFLMGITYAAFYSNSPFVQYYNAIVRIDHEFSLTLINFYIEGLSHGFAFFALAGLVEAAVAPTSDDIPYIPLLTDLNLPVVSLSFKWNHDIAEGIDLSSHVNVFKFWRATLYPKLKNREDFTRINDGTANLMKYGFGEDESQWRLRVEIELSDVHNQASDEYISDERKRSIDNLGKHSSRKKRARSSIEQVDDEIESPLVNDASDHNLGEHTKNQRLRTQKSSVPVSDTKNADKFQSNFDISLDSSIYNLEESAAVSFDWSKHERHSNAQMEIVDDETAVLPSQESSNVSDVWTERQVTFVMSIDFSQRVLITK